MNDINYDEILLGEAATITLRDKKYEIKEPTLEVILTFERERKKMVGIKDIPKAATQMIRIIRTVYTTIPEEAFEGFAPKVLYQILADVSKLVSESMLPAFANEGKGKTAKLGNSKTPKKKLTTGK